MKQKVKSGDDVCLTDLEEIIICQCCSAEHQMLFRGILDEPRMASLDIHLSPLSFWGRLRHGIKYIFGYRCKYGDFDEVILTDEHIEKLQKVIDYLRG